MSFEVQQPGILSLLLDGGRFGQHGIGLTTGGPADREAYAWANRLLGNDPNATAVEVSFGGLVLTAQNDGWICITGAELPFTIDGEEAPAWTTVAVRKGQEIALGYATAGCRAYLAVAGGFDVVHQFGSSATVVREGIGGLNGGPLRAGDTLPCASGNVATPCRLATEHQPRYTDELTLRLIPGYQQAHFSPGEQARLFHAEYVVGERCDRMGYRLEGAAIGCDIQGILSEGICLGAVQIPADGQPIVLLQDRQTIGGYPKMGSVLSLDCAALAQLRPGARVRFTPVTMEEAHNALHLAAFRFRHTPVEALA